MKINHGRARPPSAPGTRAKTDGSAIRPYLLLALFLASCAAPDTQHHIVISTRDQKLAVLDRGNLLATYPVSTSKFGLGDYLRSSRTPLGQFEVAKKIGDNAPLGAVFSGPIERPEAIPGIALTSDAFTIVTAAPIPTILYNWMMSLERIRMQP